MRIGIDARFLGPAGTGIGRYTQKLIENLEKIDRKNKYVIFLRKENFNLYEPANPNFRKVLADIPWYGLGEQIILPTVFSREKLDLLHVPHFNVPLFYRGKFVITIHDLIKNDWAGTEATTKGPLEYWIKRLGYRVVIRCAVRQARRIITPSNYVKDRLVELFKVNPKKIAVTYEAGTLLGKGRTTGERKVEDVLGRFKITKPYFLYVGNVYPYKNVGRLLEAIRILNKKMGESAQLVLVGARDVFRERLEREIVRKDVLKYVVLTGYVSDPDLIDLYRGAEAYVQPSLSEGFGLTSVEAMSLGTPVVEANTSCLPEVAGDAALYFDPYNPQDIATKLAQILGNKKLEAELSRGGIARAKRYSWEKLARQTLSVYEDAVNG